MTARSEVVERDSERGALIVLWENSGNVQVQRSTDGGATWSTAADAKLGGASFTGLLLDCTMDPRRGNLILSFDQAGSKIIAESNDLGATFTTRLS